ncbi:hypothetical protein GX51_00804 [Blastomyces parvus]|uniref:Uncharacterized protein n=1 Tax=Blastomyces parvus TaxID=2060905 RepID=A0A2B7XKQ6_9EURO|nr:hypothetical protein GX51_00804 [Blastomyces parvus]
MHFSIFLTTFTFALIGTQTAIALPAPMNQVEQSAQMTLSIQDQQRLQELQLQQNIQGEHCLRTCYPKRPVCNGGGSSKCWTCCVKT